MILRDALTAYPVLSAIAALIGFAALWVVTRWDERHLRKRECKRIWRRHR